MPTSGIMISGRTDLPFFLTSMAASMMARTCMSPISGNLIGKRQPRRPSIGLASWSCSTRRLTFSTGMPSWRGDLALAGVVVGQELVQRRIEQADGHRQAVHRLEDADEVLLLVRLERGQGLLAAGLVVGEDHLPHVDDALAFEEHVLGAAEADPLGTELAGLGGVFGRVGVGPDLERADLVGPATSARRSGRRSWGRRSGPCRS